MTWPIVDLTFWNPGDPRSDAIDRLLADPNTPLAKHGLTGIAYAYSRATDAPLHDVHEAWAEHLTATSLGVDGTLNDVVALFDELGVDCFIAKGPVIAYSLYDDPGLRPYCDLDVYVRPAEAASARRALGGIGFTAVHHATGVLGGLAQELHGGRFGATVELHTSVVDNLHRHHLPEIDAFLNHVDRSVVAGVKAPVLTPGAHLALQAIHAAAAHRYAKLILLRDIELALANTPPAPSPEVAAPSYLAVLADLIAAFGRSIERSNEVENLRRPLVRALLRSDPTSWDEYRLSVANVLALLHQARFRTTVQCAALAAASLRPRRNRRVALRTGGGRLSGTAFEGRA